MGAVTVVYDGGREDFGEYTTRVFRDGVWDCPDGYTDTGKGWEDGAEEGKKQCRRMATGMKARHFRKEQIKARKLCGPKPATDEGCQSWKCKKYGKGRAWVCAAGKDNRMTDTERKSGRKQCSCPPGQRYVSHEGRMGCFVTMNGAYVYVAPCTKA